MSIFLKKSFQIIIALLITLTCVNFVNANEALVFPYTRDNGNVYYFDNLVQGADPNTFEYINQNYIKDANFVFCRGNKIENADRDTLIEMKYRYAKDKNNVYRDCSILPEVDSSSFEIISYVYTKDKKNVYNNDNIIENADPNSFEILVYTNHGIYSKDKNHVYLSGNVANEIYNIDNTDMYNNLKGKIILKVEELGEAYYINTDFQIMHYLGRPADAFKVMRKQGLGITEKDFNSYNNYAPKNLSGKILLRVEADGEAYYVNPINLKIYYLGRPTDAFNIMRNLGLGISTNNFNKL